MAESDRVNIIYVAFAIKNREKQLTYQTCWNNWNAKWIKL